MSAATDYVRTIPRPAYDPLACPTPDGERRYDEDCGIPCLCTSACPNLCIGTCGCPACTARADDDAADRGGCP